MVIQVPSKQTNIKLEKLMQKIIKVDGIQGVFPGFNKLDNAPALLIHGHDGWNIFLNPESKEEDKAIVLEYIITNKKAISLVLKDASLYDIYFQIKES